ncbi:MAG TPA: S41 family peptidase [Actinomycetota bacterium]|nr:S41 family peptidase [Actinomycetota bacterium]
MRDVRPVFIGALIVAVLAAGTFVAGTRVGDPRSSGWDAVEGTADELRRDAARPISEEELIQAAIEGMLSVLDDPYAASLGPEEVGEVRDLIDGSIVGIGVWLRESPAGLRVTDVVDGSPAVRVGLTAGDVIVRAEGRSMRGVGVGDAAQEFKGEVGSSMELLVERDGETRTVRVERARIEIPDVESRMIQGAGYARLHQFGRGAADELSEAIDGLLDRGARGVVLDLRGNAGGLADEALGVADLFLDGGVVARVRERGEPERTERADAETLGAFPLVVLVDGGTASASELVAGALQDRGRATLVGLTTFGKGSVLTVADVGEDTTIQYTTAFFYTPDGHAIEGEGVHPDVPVEPGDEDDEQLDRALRLLGG